MKNRRQLREHIYYLSRGHSRGKGGRRAGRRATERAGRWAGEQEGIGRGRRPGRQAAKRAGRRAGEQAGMVGQPKKRTKMSQLVGHVAVGCGRLGWNFECFIMHIWRLYRQFPLFSKNK